MIVGAAIMFVMVVSTTSDVILALLVITGTNGNFALALHSQRAGGMCCKTGQKENPYCSHASKERRTLSKWVS